MPISPPIGVRPSHQADLSDASDSADSLPPGSRESSLPSKSPFRRPEPARAPLLSPRQTSQWRLHHEGFVQALASRLSLFFRAELTLAQSGPQVLTYQCMTESWHDPAHFTLFKAEPLRGVAILHIPTPLGLCMADRLMGGSGCSGTARQEMGAIENALLEQVAHVVAGEWCAHAAPLLETKPVLLGHEGNSRFLQTAPPQAAMLLMALDATLGNCREQMQIAFPFAALEPFLLRLAARTPAPPIRSRRRPRPAPGIPVSTRSVSP